MIGDIKGYCVLRSTTTVVYEGNPDELLNKPLRIMDVAVDDSGFLILNIKGTALAMVELADVLCYFFCDSLEDVLIPTGLNFLQKFEEAGKRLTIEGGYTREKRATVIVNSLVRGKFNDDFLFDENKDK